MESARSSSGFSLVELLVSVTILTTGILALALTLATASHARVSDSARSAVLAEARDVREEIRAYPASLIHQDFDGRVIEITDIPGSNASTGSIAVAVDDSEPTLLRVTITATWSVAGEESVMVIESLATNLD